MNGFTERSVGKHFKNKQSFTFERLKKRTKCCVHEPWMNKMKKCKCAHLYIYIYNKQIDGQTKNIYLYHKTRHLSIYIYRLSIAGQTARPIGQNFFWTLMGSWVAGRLKKIWKFFFLNFFSNIFHGQRRALFS